MTSHVQEIKDAGGLFALVNLRIKERRATLRPASQWYAPVPTFVSKGKGTVVMPSTKPEPIVFERIVPITIDAVDDEVEQPHEDDPQEVCAAPKQVEAGEDEPEEAGEEGTVSDDVVTVDGD
jgi:hypothetical protein